MVANQVDHGDEESLDNSQHKDVLEKRSSLNETAEKKALIDKSGHDVEEQDKDLERYMNSTTSSSVVNQAWTNYKRRILTFFRQPREAFMLLLPLLYIVTFTCILNSFTKGLTDEL